MTDQASVSIRPATQADVGAIASILRGLDWFIHFEQESVDETKARISQHLALCQADDSHTVLVAEHTDENEESAVLGYVAAHWLPYLMLTGPEGYVSELFLHEAARGKGIGRRLLEEIKNQARVRGCSRLALVNMRQRPSYQRGFYRKLGWKEREQAAHFILPID